MNINLLALTFPIGPIYYKVSRLYFKYKIYIEAVKINLNA